MIRLTFYDERGDLRDTRVIEQQPIKAVFEGSPFDGAISRDTDEPILPVAHCNFIGGRMEIESV